MCGVVSRDELSKIRDRKIVFGTANVTFGGGLKPLSPYPFYDPATNDRNKCKRKHEHSTET